MYPKTTNYNINNELIITINTSIPGYKKIDFKPSQLKLGYNDKNDIVYFDPLINIRKNTIETIPEDKRKSSFINKGLFETLLNNNINTKKKSLLYAKYNGYIDNNINITLNTILPEGSIIYFNNNPYIITYIQWTKGSWKIKTNTDISGNATDKLFIMYGQNYNGSKINNYEALQTVDIKKGGDNIYNTYNTHNYYNKRNPYNYTQKYNKYNTNKPFYITYISIDLGLHPGTSITPKELKKYKCDYKWNAVKKAYSKFIGKPYLIKPIYNKTIKRIGGIKRKQRSQSHTKKYK